jgi:hypothetical protein
MNDEYTLRYLETNEWPRFRDIFIKIFGEWEPDQLPQIIVLAESSTEVEEDGSPVILAFATFTRVKISTVYLQYFGTNPDHRSLVNHRIFEKIFKFINVDTRIEYVTMRVHQLNKEALIAALNFHFIPVGFVQEYVEFLREINVGDK